MCFSHQMAVAQSELQPGDVSLLRREGIDPSNPSNPSGAGPGGTPLAPSLVSPNMNIGGDEEESDNLPRSNSKISDDFTEPSYTVKRPTKLGQLMKIAAPMMIGAGIGATSNSRQPGAGLASSETFFNHLNDMRMRAQQNQILNADRTSQQREREANTRRADATANYEMNRPTFTEGSLVKGIDSDPQSPTNGKLVYMQRNSKTGKLESTGQLVPESEKWSIQDTDQGLMRVNMETGDVAPLRKPSIATSNGIPRDQAPGQRPVSAPTDEEEPLEGEERPGLTAGQIPDMSEGPSLVATGQSPMNRGGGTGTVLHRRGKEVDTDPKPRAEVVTDAKGVQATQYRDMNPRSTTYGQVINVPHEATRQPKPKNVVIKPKPEDVEAMAEEALKAESGDADKAVDRITKAQIPDGVKTFVRQRIREMKRPGQKKNVFEKYGITPGDLAGATHP